MWSHEGSPMFESKSEISMRVVKLSTEREHDSGDKSLEYTGVYIPLMEINQVNKHKHLIKY